MTGARRFGLTLLVVVALLGMLAACGSGSSAAEGPTATPAHSSTATPAPTPTPRPTLPPTPSAVDPSVQAMEMVQVLGAVGGDAVEVMIGSAPTVIGYRGIAVPAGTEKGSPGAAATLANADLLVDHWLFLEGEGGRDARGRRMYYVWLADGRFVNAELVRLGLARVETAGFDAAHKEWLLAAQAAALADKTSLLEVSSIRLDGTGKAQPDEHIEITNPGEVGLDMSGWRVEAGDKEQYLVIANGFTLAPGETCRFYTNQVLDDSCGKNTFGQDKPILNNGGDCGQFYDALGLLIVERCVERGEN